MSWYAIIADDLGRLQECSDFFNAELEGARRDLGLRGQSLERASAMLPGLFEHRFCQLQELEAILEYLNIQLRNVRAAAFKRFMEMNDRALSSRDAEKYTDGDASVVSMSVMVNEFALVRNRFLGLIKGFDQKAWQIGHITKLRCAGLDDVIIG